MSAPGATKVAERAARLAATLDRDGYCIVRRAIAPDVVRQLDADLDRRFADTPFCEGGFYGARTKRFGSLLKRSDEAKHLVAHPLVLDLVDRQLGPWCDRFNLNLTQAVEIHSGALPQLPHRDQDMWAGPKGEVEYLVNVMWPLTEFTAENGATVLWPGSHHRQDMPMLPDGDAVVAAMEPGDALLFLGSTLHGGGSNCASLPRRGVIISYCLGWLKPFENQWLVYPPAVARRFDPDLAALVGYSQHRPNLGNYEGRCPSVLLANAVPDYLAAADALRPDQAAQLADYVDGQRRAE